MQPPEYSRVPLWAILADLEDTRQTLTGRPAVGTLASCRYLPSGRSRNEVKAQHPLEPGAGHLDSAPASSSSDRCEHLAEPGAWGVGVILNTTKFYPWRNAIMENKLLPLEIYMMTFHKNIM